MVFSIHFFKSSLMNVSFISRKHNLTFFYFMDHIINIFIYPKLWKVFVLEYAILVIMCRSVKHINQIFVYRID